MKSVRFSVWRYCGFHKVEQALDRLMVIARRIGKRQAAQHIIADADECLARENLIVEGNRPREEHQRIGKGLDREVRFIEAADWGWLHWNGSSWVREDDIESGARLQ